jgi:DNA-binding PadR family transcriptional regulator
MTSTLGHVLLGLLARAPGTGYDLAGRLRRPVGYFWSAGHSQIYPELARLEKAGQVRHTVIDGAGPRATKRYQLTAAGRRSLRTWLLATTPDVDPKEILLRVYFLFVLSQDEATAVMTSIRQHHRRTLEHYRSAEAIRDPRQADRERFGPDYTADATLQWGITFEEERIRWCERVLAHLGDLARPGERSVRR